MGAGRFVRAVGRIVNALRHDCKRSGTAANTMREWNDGGMASEQAANPHQPRNVLGNELEPCGPDPLTGFYRDGFCNTGPEDLGNTNVYAVATSESLSHQAAAGNELRVAKPEYGFSGVGPGDRWCVCAARWREAYEAGVAPPVVLAATHIAALEEVDLAKLREHAVDVPADPSGLT